MNKTFELPKNQVNHTSINAEDNIRIVYISPNGSWQIKELGYLKDARSILEIVSYKTNISSFPDTSFPELNRMKDRVKSNTIGKSKGDQETNTFGSNYGSLSPTSTSDSLEKCPQSTVIGVNCHRRGSNNSKRNYAKNNQLLPNKIITKFKFINNNLKYDSAQHFSNSGKTSDYDSEFSSISERENNSEAYNDSSNKQKLKDKNNSKWKTSEGRRKFNKTKYVCIENKSNSKVTSSDEQISPFSRRQQISDIVSDNLSVLELVCSRTTDESDVGDVTPFNSVECKKVKLKDKTVIEESPLFENQKDSKNKQVVPDIFITLNKKSIQPQLKIDAFTSIHGSQTKIYDPDYVNSCSNTKAKSRLNNDKSESIFVLTQELDTGLEVLPDKSSTKIKHVCPDSDMKECKTVTHKNNLHEKGNMSNNKVTEEKFAVAGYHKISDCISNNSLSKSTETADFLKTELNVNSTMKREIKKKMEKIEIKSKSEIAEFKSHKITACVKSQEEILAKDKKVGGLCTETTHEVQKIGSSQDKEQKLKSYTGPSPNADEKHLFEEPLQQKGCNNRTVDLNISPRINKKHMDSRTKIEMCSSSSICKSQLNEVNSINLDKCNPNCMEWINPNYKSVYSDNLVLLSEETREKLKKKRNSFDVQNQPIGREEITQLEITVEKHNLNNNNRTNEEEKPLVGQPQEQVKKEGKTTSIVDTKLETGKMFNTDNRNKHNKIKLKTNSTKGTGINSFEDSRKQTDFLNSDYPLETNKAVKQTIEEEISASNFSTVLEIDEVIGTGANPEEKSLLEKSEKLVMSDASVGNLHSEFETEENVSTRKSTKYEKVKLNSNNSTSLEGKPVYEEVVKQAIEKENTASNFSSVVKIDEVMNTGANPEERSLLEKSEKLVMSDASVGNLHSEFKTVENVSPRKSKKSKNVKLNSNNTTSLEGNRESEEVQDTLMNDTNHNNLLNEIDANKKKHKKYKLKLDCNITTEEKCLSEDVQEITGNCLDVLERENVLRTRTKKHKDKSTDSEILNTYSDGSGSGYHISIQEPCRNSNPQSIPTTSKRKLDLNNTETVSKKHKKRNINEGEKMSDETTAAEERQNRSDCINSTKHNKDDPGHSETDLSLYIYDTPSKKVKKHKEDKVMGSNKISVEPVLVSSTPFPGSKKEKKKLALFGENSCSNINSSNLDSSTINSSDLTILEEIQSQIITSSSDLKRLENLNIEIDWDLSPLHKIDTGSSRNNMERLKEKLGPQYSLNSNKFTKKEEKLIKRSWEEFAQAYNFEDPELFFPSRQNFGVFSRQERHNFKLFLAKYLPDRRLFSVYNKFCALYGIENRGRWSEKEDQLLLELYFAFQEENSLDHEDDDNYEQKQFQVKYAFPMKKIMQKALRRSWSSIDNRLKMLLQNEHARNLACQDITWTPELEGKLLHNLLKKSKANSIEDLRYATIPYKVWRKVATKMDLPLDKIVNQWKYHLYPQLFARFPILRHKLYIQLIKWFYKSDIREWKTIDWADLSRRAADLGSCYLYRVFKTLVGNVVPKYCHKHFRDCVVFLHEYYIPELKQKKQSHVLIRKYYDPETRTLNLREEDELDCPKFRIK